MMITDDKIAKEIERNLDGIRAAAKADVPMTRHEGINTGKDGPLTVGAEIDRFVATARRLYDAQRQKVLSLESEHERAVTALVDRYRVRLRNLEHEAGEALRECEESHSRAIADERRMLAKLKALREG